MEKKIIDISLDKIKLSTKLDITKTYLDRMKRIDKELLIYDKILAVEKIPGTDQYLLVGGHDKYNYLLSTREDNAPCIVENQSSSLEEQHVKLLRRLFNNGTCTKSNRQTTLDLLNQLLVSADFIMKKTGLTRNELESNYTYNPNIPEAFINEHTIEKTMNWIATLPLDHKVKEFLYTRAGLPVGNPKRLTNDNIKIIKKFIKNEPRFYYLTVTQQIDILQYAIVFKGTVLNLMASMIDEYYNIKKAM